jgi:hypothetical protein
MHTKDKLAQALTEAGARPAVGAMISSFVMFVQYMREDADDDGNSKRPAGVNRVQSIAEGQALGPARAQEGPKMTVLIYVNTSKPVGDADHLRVFATSELADEWFKENDPEGVAFESRPEFNNDGVS